MHVLILTGKGEKFFSAGANIKMLTGMTPNSSTTSAFTQTKPSTGSSKRQNL